MRFFSSSGCTKLQISSTNAQTLLFLLFFQPFSSYFLGSFRQFHSFTLCVCSPALSQGLAGDTHRDFCSSTLCSCLLSARFRLFKLRTLPSQFSEPVVLCLNSSSLRCSWEVVPRQKAGQLVSPCEFFFFERLLSFTVSFPLPENHCQVLSSFMAQWPFLVGGLVLYH